ncbi:dihydrodipicolinate synthase family protein [Phototrophicus methaneseepsis]|uniref:Dihydrodipicolinate synthase family protein n=1 Tax=Phototrophicus methaneseepsis TaxID=2710758 RepID=A0A7S8E544_9CHLR|nr:dihydrodipicolinate synthase family protein [Phototrophicus methaneseepsis]QPC80525.1 dihydrodipicolinate synthase family protein [Phototrophicus methaneseepsis]
MADLHGVIPPLLTPLHADGSIDVESIHRLVAHLTEAGVHGLFPLGSTGEAAQLTNTQRRQVLEAVIEANQGKLPILAGIIASSTASAIEYAEEAHQLGVDAVVATAPYYYTYSQPEIIAHFRQLHAAVDIPIVAYNIPSMVKMNLDQKTINTLAQEGTIIALKDTSGDVSATRGIMLACEGIEGFHIFSGLEWVSDIALEIGADGLVPGIGNIAPADYVAIYDAIQNGDLETARHHQRRMIELFNICYHGHSQASYSAGALGGFKTAMQLLGIFETRQMAAPMTTIPDENVAPIREILEKLDLLPIEA